jgi:sugar lactone lactonase YvrE
VWRRAALAAAIALGFVGQQAAGAAPPAIGTTTVFADVPEPGHPFGVLPTDDGVYVATSKASPLRPYSGEEMVFKYGVHGGHEPIASSPVMAMPTMGLHDIAEDGDGRIYVVDMNSRVLRFTSHGAELSAPEVYAQVPEPYASLGWEGSMWQNIAFDAAGNLYITDASLGAIWRVRPNGTPTIWFQDPELLSMQLAGVNGIAVSPDRTYLYFLLASSPLPDRVIKAFIYRLPLTTASPRSNDLHLFHTFELDPAAHPSPFPVASDLAFAQSGNLYVALTGSNQIAEVDPHGHEVRRISNAAFDLPIGVRFQGTSLLVANSNYLPPEDQTWAVLQVYVGEPGLPLIKPRIRAGRPGRCSNRAGGPR